MTDQFEVKAALTVTETGEITGLAWPFGTPDRVGDMIEKGAISAPAAVPMLWAHDQAQVIGVWDQITETAEGLTIKGKLLVDDVERAREVRAMIRAGAVSGLSIGFVAKNATRSGKGRKITALDLHEVSIVAVPCHPGAKITSLKSQSIEEIMENTDPAQKAEIQTPANDAPQVELKAFEAVKARLDALEAKAQRPGVVAAGPDASAERKAFINYLQTGQVEAKALTTASDTANHVLAPEDVSSEFIRNLVEFSPIRQIADVRSTTSANVILPKRTGITNARWVGETEERTGSEPTFGQMNVPVYELATFVDMSLQLAEDSANVLNEVNLALAEDFGQKEALAFVNGGTFTAPATAPKDPSGFLTNAEIATFNSGHVSILDPNALILMMYDLPATYRNAGTWVMNGQTLARIRTLKDGHGNYLWQPSYQAGQPETILGRPVVEAVDMPDIDEDAEPIIFGDFKRGYRIYDRLDLSVFADPYSVRIHGQMRYHARHRVGAGVVRPAAFIKLAMAA